MTPDEVEDQTAALPIEKAEAAAKLLLEHQRTLRRAKKEQRVCTRDVDAFVVQVDSDDRADLTPREAMRLLRGAAGPREGGGA
mgnify:CR=1 FL=1